MARRSEFTAGVVFFVFFFGQEEQVREEKRERARCPRVSAESRLHTHQFTRDCVSGTGAGGEAAMGGSVYFAVLLTQGGKKPNHNRSLVKKNNR